LDLALALQGIVGRLSTNGHESSHGLFVPLDHKRLTSRRAFQQLRQATAGFFNAEGGVLHRSGLIEVSVQTVRNRRMNPRLLWILNRIPLDGSLECAPVALLIGPASAPSD
jgi:hypothetical protein